MTNLKIITQILGKTVSKSPTIANKSAFVVSSPITSVVSPSITRTNTNFLNRIDNIPLQGMKEDEKPILEMIKNSMYDLLSKSNGKAILPNEIRFERVRKNGSMMKQGVSCVTKENVLKINRDYFTHIDETIQSEIQQFMELGLITRQPNGKYNIANFLRNKKSEIFETRLNEYNKYWSLDSKFKFHRTSMNYYTNLTYQTHCFPTVTIENIMKTGENQNILKSCGLFKTKAEILKLPEEKQLEYLKEIFKKTEAQGKKLYLPDDTVIFTPPNHAINHELGHINHNSIINNEQYAKLHAPEKIAEWENNSKIQEVCSRISGYASTQPSEFVAEVFAGLANGQKFHPDVMSLYQKLRGPMIF